MSTTQRELIVLLADDDKDDALLFKEALEELPIKTRFLAVYNGEQLMQLLKKNGTELPDVLFLDLNMPRKNGFMCLEEIKRDKNLNLLPVIIFSTSFDERIAELLYKNGAQHYICKPADFSQLRRVIQKVLELVSEKNISQPSKETFLLSNLKTILL